MESLAATFTLTFMMRIATPRMMKNPQGFVGAGFKPAQGDSGMHQERFRRRAGLKPAPTKPRFVLTSERFFTLTFMASTTPNDENGEAFTLITGKADN